MDKNILIPLESTVGSECTTFVPGLSAGLLEGLGGAGARNVNYSRLPQVDDNENALKRHI